MTASLNRDQIPFGDFLEHLRHYGFTVSTAHYLRLQVLLNELKSDCSPEDLKTLFCPLFATNKEEQERFYKVFEDFFTILSPKAHPALVSSGKADPATYEPDHHRESGSSSSVRWLAPTFLAICLVLVVSFSAYVAHRAWEKPEATTTTINNDEQNPSPEDILQARSAAEKAAREKVDTARGGVVTAGGQPSSRQSFLEIDARPIAGTTEFTAGDIQYKDFYHQYWEAIRKSAIIAPLILFLIYEARRFRRRSLILLRQRGKRPPYVWPIRIPEVDLGIYSSEQFYQTTRALRRRHYTQAYRLNVTATITSTVNSLGYLNFKYETDSTVPEYLFLIDRRSSRDHQAQLFTLLSRKLEAEGIYIETYYFNKDPRVCFVVNGGRAIQLDELLHKYSGHRLVLFTDAEGLIEPISGKPEPWTSIFKGWPVRTITGPASLTRWAVHELSSVGGFSVYPCNLAGIRALADAASENEKFDSLGQLQQWPTRYPLGDTRDATREVEEIHRHLGDDLFKWLCMCAIYPELHWDLTLFLGTLPLLGNSLCNEESLLRLISLPYFRSGVIPDDLRSRLIQELGVDDVTEVRHALISILEKNSPPEESFIADTYQLNLAVQRWLARPNFKRWLKVRRSMKEVTTTRILQDLTLVKFVEATSPLAFILPRRLYNVFFRRGFPALGTRTVVRFLACLTLAAGAWFGIRRVQPVPVYHKSEQTLVGHAGKISALAFTPTGERLATAGDDNQIILWEAEEDRWRPVGYLHDGDPVLSAVAFSNTGKFVAAASGDGTALNRVSLWDAQSSQLLWQTEVSSPIKTIFFSSDEDRWLVVHQDQQITFLNPYDGTIIKQINILPGPITSVALSRDSSTLVYGDAATQPSSPNGSKNVTLMEPYTSKLKQTLSTDDGVNSLTILNDGKILITGSNEGRVKLWDTQNGNKVADLGTAGTKVRSVASSTDSRVVAVIDGNNMLRIWGSQADDLWLKYQLGQATGMSQAFCFSSEGDVLVAEAETDNSIHVWRFKEKNQTASAALPAPAGAQPSGVAITHMEQGKLAWVDRNGDFVRQVDPKDPINSFFIHGLEDAVNEAMKAENKARMQTYFELVKIWGDRGINGRVSEVFLGDLRDIRVHLAGDEAGIEVDLGDRDFGPRLERALRVIDEKQAFLNINYINATSDKRLIMGVVTRVSGSNNNANNETVINAR